MRPYYAYALRRCGWVLAAVVVWTAVLVSSLTWGWLIISAVMRLLP